VTRNGRIAVALAAAITLGFGAFAWKLSADLQGGGWLGRARELDRAAEEYAAEHDASECVAMATRLAEPCPRLLVFCAVRANAFAFRCLAEAEPSPELCVGVPAPHEVFATRDWQLERCGRRGRDEACGAIASTVQKHCHGG